LVVRGLFVGRFQPLHWGHIEVIRWALKRVDELIIVIGSAQYSHTLRNPFTAGERVEMVRLGLRDAGVDIDRTYIIPLPDIEMNHVWPRYVELMVPRFNVVIARNPLVVRLFLEYGYEVLEPPAFSRAEYSATHIRELMLRGDSSWRKLVPPSVAKFIEEIGGVERLRMIASSD
jgi:nicotinamide-nucleotide adenylyltransferase